MEFSGSKISFGFPGIAKLLFEKSSLGRQEFVISWSRNRSTWCRFPGICKIMFQQSSLAWCNLVQKSLRMLENINSKRIEYQMTGINSARYVKPSSSDFVSMVFQAKIPPLVADLSTTRGGIFASDQKIPTCAKNTVFFGAPAAHFPLYFAYFRAFRSPFDILYRKCSSMKNPTWNLFCQ